jgi:hypothetical protein
VNTWVNGDPLPPYVERRKIERRGHGDSREGEPIDGWIAVVVCVLALAGLIVVSIIGV